MARVFLALGSNLGDRAAVIAAARERLEGAGIVIVEASPVRETEPWGVQDQPGFLNQVLLAETDLPPLELLRTLKNIEAGLGRTQRERWGPREIDIDILFYDDLVLDTPELKLPHPSVHERPFIVETWNG